jgi:flagellin-like protein
MTRRMIKSRKAISPILATLLLVVIAVAAIVVTYAWIMTYMNNAGHQAGVIIYRANTNFYQNGTKIDVDIGDSGTQPTQLIALYVGTSTSTLVNQTITQVTVTPSQVGRITINYDWTSGVNYYFRILTSSGLVYDWVDTAPVS